MKIITIYDNYKIKKELEIGWGFSCLIKINNKDILFDTGEKAEPLLYNIGRLEIKIEDIDILVVSHNHWDHTGGLSTILKLNPNIKLYKPESFSEPTKIIENVYTTGALGIWPKEQSLIINTDKGLVVITGCAHPGIVNIVKKAKESFNKKIYLVLGGFHLGGATAVIKDFKALGVEKVAPSHCTGDRAIQLFKEEYKEDFIKNGVGKIIIV